MYKKVINKLINKQNLRYEEARNFIELILDGNIYASQIAAFLTALKIKGETSEEIAAFASKIIEKAPNIDINGFGTTVDSCGTGGDYANTFNISTASAILASCSGLKVAKHSNFGFTSKCGSSNVLESLGINLAQNSDEVTSFINKNNIAFLHAPYFHKCTSFVAPVRKELGFRTIFNLLGPLTNPVRLDGQVLGVSDSLLCKKMVESLKILGCKRALLVNSKDPVLDEISICGKTSIYELKGSNLNLYQIHPQDFGIKQAKIEDISGDTPEVNANIIRDIFINKKQGPRMDAVAINTAALLYIGNNVSSFEDGVKKAYSLIENNSACLKMKEISN